MKRAVGNQAALITAKHYVDNPPAHGAGAGLASEMQVIEHPKGPTWIEMNGMDVNLGGSGATSRAINNGLTSIREDKAEPGDAQEDVIEVVGVLKG